MSEAHLSLGAGREFDAIRAMFEEWGPRASGVGDDAAVLSLPAGSQLVVSTDSSVEDVHFRRAWMTPAEIGERAATAALSDLAAMAAIPAGVLLALALPGDWDAALLDLARGVGAACARAGCPIVGGNLTRARELSLTLTVLGHAERPLHRAGAQAGDRVVVTGRLGGPGAALDALLAGRTPPPPHRARFVAPAARIREARWLAARGAHAAIDISDGLLADATHLARASEVTLALDLALVPRMEDVSAEAAAASGEEYELLVVMPNEFEPEAPEFARTFEVPLTQIGVVEERGSEPVTLRGVPAGTLRGHDHFR